MNTCENAFKICKSKEDYTSENLIFLHPEQIRVFSAGQTGRGSENRRIRMAESIRKYGVLQPFPVRAIRESNGFTGYQLIGDQERFRAVCIAGIDKIPCRLLSGEDKQCIELSLLSEIQEKNPHFFEEALLFERLLREFGMKQSEIAAKLGRSQSSVANKLRLLQLTADERESIRRAGLGERHARALLRLSEPILRREAMETVILHRLSVVETERLVERFLSRHVESAAKRQSLQQEELPSGPRDFPGEQGGPTQKAPSFRSNSASCSSEYPPQTGTTSSMTPLFSDHLSEFSGVLPPESGCLRNPAEKEPTPFPVSQAQGFSNGENPRRVTAQIPEPQGIRPRKFILHDLQPLYHSIERTLSIFRKTGIEAECTREERADCVQINIYIPKKAPSGHS